MLGDVGLCGGCGAVFDIVGISKFFLLGGCCEFAKQDKSGTSSKALICLEKMFSITVTETIANGNNAG